MTSQHTIEDVFTVLQSLSIRMDKRFDGVDQGMDRVQTDITALRTDVTTLQADVTMLQTDLDDLAMATKEGFDSVDRRFDSMAVRISRPWRRIWFD